MLSPLVTECRRKDRRIAQLENALAWLRDELTSEGSPDTPDHGHEKRGRWDSNGKPCEECAAFRKVWGLVKHIPHKP